MQRSHASRGRLSARAPRAHARVLGARARARPPREGQLPGPCAAPAAIIIRHPTVARRCVHGHCNATMSVWRRRRSVVSIRGLAPPPPAQAFLFPPTPEALGVTSVPAVGMAALEPGRADALPS